MCAKQNLKALVYAHNAVKARMDMSKKTMMTIINIGKDSHSIPMVEMATTLDTRWKTIQSFDRLSNIFHFQLGSHSVADLVTAMSNAIYTEMAAAYEEARAVSKVVQGAATKAENLDGIGYLNGKFNSMTEFPKVE